MSKSISNEDSPSFIPPKKTLGLQECYHILGGYSRFQFMTTFIMINNFMSGG